MSNERVSDERLANLIALSKVDGWTATAAALTELQQRRASVVTEEMVERAKAELLKCGIVDTFSVRAALTAGGGPPDDVVISQVAKHFGVPVSAAINRAKELGLLSTPVSHETGDGEPQARAEAAEASLAAMTAERDAMREALERISRDYMQTGMGSKPSRGAEIARSALSAGENGR